MSRVKDEIVRAVAEGRVTPSLQALAQRVLDDANRRAELAAGRSKGDAQAFADRRRAREEREEAEAKREMHAAVWAWNVVVNGARCDNPDCGRPFRHADEGECDHWIERSQGGPHHRSNGWRLCTSCHHAKTNNDPDRATWNVRRQRYCTAAEIPFVPRRVR